MFKLLLYNTRARVDDFGSKLFTLFLLSALLVKQVYDDRD